MGCGGKRLGSEVQGDGGNKGCGVGMKGMGGDVWGEGRRGLRLEDGGETR